MYLHKKTAVPAGTRCWNNYFCAVLWSFSGDINAAKQPINDKRKSERFWFFLSSMQQNTLQLDLTEVFTYFRSVSEVENRM